MAFYNLAVMHASGTGVLRSCNTATEVGKVLVSVEHEHVCGIAKCNVQLQRIIYTYNVRVKRLVLSLCDGQVLHEPSKANAAFFVKLREGNKTAPFTSLGLKHPSCRPRDEEKDQIVHTDLYVAGKIYSHRLI